MDDNRTTRKIRGKKLFFEPYSNDYKTFMDGSNFTLPGLHNTSHITLSYTSSSFIIYFYNWQKANKTAKWFYQNFTNSTGYITCGFW